LPSATAGTTFIFYDLTITVAGGACRYLRKAAKGSSRCAPHLTHPVASGASSGLGARFCPTATTGRAGFQMGDADFLIATKNSLAEVQLQVIPQVFASGRAAASSSPTGLACCPRKAAKEAFENVGKSAEIAKVLSPSGSSANARFAKLIVSGPYFWLRENLVGPIYLLKSLLCPALFVDVGMIFTGKTTIRPLNFIFIGTAGNIKNIVVVAEP